MLLLWTCLKVGLYRVNLKTKFRLDHSQGMIRQQTECGLTLCHMILTLTTTQQGQPSENNTTIILSYSHFVFFPIKCINHQLSSISLDSSKILSFSKLEKGRIELIISRFLFHNVFYLIKKAKTYHFGHIYHTIMSLNDLDEKAF